MVGWWSPTSRYSGAGWLDGGPPPPGIQGLDGWMVVPPSSPSVQGLEWLYVYLVVCVYLGKREKLNFVPGLLNIFQERFLDVGNLRSDD